MILALALALSARAEPCEGAIDDYIAAVRDHGEKDAYLCLASLDAAESPLMVAIAHTEPVAPSRTVLDANSDPAAVQDAVAVAEADRSRNSLSRALALHLAARLDRALTAEEVHALGMADRRLLRDAVYARRGRKSPAPEHDKVFAQLPWYAPDAGFDNGRLTEQDRANLAMIDHPPAPPEPPKPEPAALALVDVAGPEQKAGGCRCDAAGGGGVAGLLPLLLGVRRRRGTRKGEASSA